MVPYWITSGNDGGAFEIDAYGHLRVVGDLNFDIQPGYLIELELTNSSIGETTSATAAVFLKNPLVDSELFPDEGDGTPGSGTIPIGPPAAFMNPGNFTANVVIDRIRARRPDPTGNNLGKAEMHLLDRFIRFGDLHPALQDAINFPNKFIISTLGGGKWMILDINKSSIITVNGPALVEVPLGKNRRRANEWIKKLIEEEYEHKEYLYYKEMGLAAFFKTLRKTSRSLKFSNTGTGAKAVATYSYTTDTITYTYNKKIKELKIATIIHETVHAVDDINNWYQPVGSTENIEALGWTTEHLLNRFGFLSSLRTLENKIAENTFTYNEIEELWKNVATKMKNVLGETIAYISLASPKERTVTVADIKDVQSKLLPKFKVASLATKYKATASEKGVSYAFPLTGIKSGASNTTEILSVFR